jgi:beta-glucanase (GH16 family)
LYEVEWDEQRVIGKIDNINYFVKVIDPDTMAEFLQEYFLILNVAVGGNLGGSPDETTDWPQSMLVDWVRVYQREESLIPGGDLWYLHGYHTGGRWNHRGCRCRDLCVGKHFGGSGDRSL